MLLVLVERGDWLGKEYKDHERESESKTRNIMEFGIEGTRETRDCLLLGGVKVRKKVRVWVVGSCGCGFAAAKIKREAQDTKKQDRRRGKKWNVEQEREHKNICRCLWCAQS